MNSIEIFDPSTSTRAQKCAHVLNVARYSGGAFAVTKNVMCVLGGKDQQGMYLDSIELVSDTSTTLLSSGTVFTLPQPMACFGVAALHGKVYVIGGKGTQGALDCVYEAEISHFVNASKGINVHAPNDTIWTLVGRLTTDNGPAPRHSFSLLVEGDVLWLIGGFDGRNLLKSLGLYHVTLKQYIHHPQSLAVPRNGLSSFMLGKSILVFGGIISATNSVSNVGASRTNYSSQAAITELLLRENQAFAVVPNFDCPQQDQRVYQIGNKMFAIGQFNILTEGPLCTIASMDLFSLREAFELEEKFDGVGTLMHFPMPVVPMEPAEPKMSPDVEKLKHSIAEWEQQVEANKSEYHSNVQKATATAQAMHEEVVGSLKEEISKKTAALNAAKPDVPNSHDIEVTNEAINVLRLEFERQIEKLELELDMRIQRRNDEYEIYSTKYIAQINELESAIADSDARLHKHQTMLHNNLVTWVDEKTTEVTKMKEFVYGTLPTKKPVYNTDSALIAEDGAKIKQVYLGKEVEPAVVSNGYGRHCTSNYDIKNQIGTGGFGKVYQGNDVSIRCSFAIKRVSMPDNKPENLQIVLKSFHRELSVRYSLHFVHVLATYFFYSLTANMTFY